MHARFVTKGEQHIPDRSNKGRVVATRQVGATDRSGEKRITHEEIRSCRPVLPYLPHPSYLSYLPYLPYLPDLKADTPGTVARRMVRTHLAVAKDNHLAGRIELVNRRKRSD